MMAAMLHLDAAPVDQSEGFIDRPSHVGMQKDEPGGMFPPNTKKG